MRLRLLLILAPTLLMAQTPPVPGPWDRQDIRDPYAPREAAYFIPAPMKNTVQTCATINGQKECKRSIETNNAELDDRGLIYIVDRAGTGMHILRLTIAQ